GAAVASPHEDIANARVRFANGCVATVTASRISFRTERRMRIFAAEGYLAVDFAARRLTLIGRGRGVRRLGAGRRAGAGRRGRRAAGAGGGAGGDGRDGGEPRAGGGLRVDPATRGRRGPPRLTACPVAGGARRAPGGSPGAGPRRRRVRGAAAPTRRPAAPVCSPAGSARGRSPTPTK